MRAVVPSSARLLDQLEVRLVDQRRRRQRAVLASRGETVVCDGTELMVGERDDAIERLWSAALHLREDVGGWRQRFHGSMDGPTWAVYVRPARTRCRVSARPLVRRMRTHAFRTNDCAPR